MGVEGGLVTVTVTEVVIFDSHEVTIDPGWTKVFWEGEGEVSHLVLL